MFHTTIIKPRFSETDKLGHISNTVFPVWMAESRSDFCRSALEITQPWVVANISIDFKNEVLHGDDVVVNTCVERIGGKSVTFYQEMFQYEKRCVVGRTTVVCIDKATKQSCSLNNSDKEKLQPYLAV
ncbi:thioesterase [Marinomonas sp. UCMA 3892]|jgi:acyl-CoA thioester hydrolase|uniref:acyl-CoA thioesterase n=1 Tax=unclassified Marinomonas TaxID=196814 RepID=UPI00146EE061|nr:thioesterase family protein [Marinomonas sp. UCMA 3892]NLU99143.1 thioesterase [Marinomonas sp. UCMA 3892]